MSDDLKPVIEALIFASPDPLTPKMLFKLLEIEVQLGQIHRFKRFGQIAMIAGPDNGCISADEGADLIGETWECRGRVENVPQFQRSSWDKFLSW